MWLGLPWGLQLLAAARVGMLVFGVVIALQARAQTSALTASTGTTKWEPHIDVELKPGNKRWLGTADVFVPLSQTDDTLVFGDLRVRVGNSYDFEGNIGLGVRRMLPSGWNVGAYAFWDHRETPSGNLFSQATLGAEALGRNWDIRANVYQPLGKKMREIDPLATASFAGNTLVVTSQTRYERALGGYDAELGWRAPVFDVEDRRQLRFYAGGFHFSGGGATVAGPRLRVEYTAAELDGLWKGTQLTLAAETQNDGLRGRQNFISARLRVPLGGSSSSQKLNAQERRMTEHVVRDVDIVSKEEKRAPVSEAVTTLADGRAITVINGDVTPGNALSGGVQAAGANSFVLLHGTFQTPTTVNIQAGQAVVGGATFNVRIQGGAVAQVTTPSATIIATNPGPLLNFAAADSLATGLDLVAPLQSASIFSGSPAGSLTVNFGTTANPGLGLLNGSIPSTPFLSGGFGGLNGVGFTRN